MITNIYTKEHKDDAEEELVVGGEIHPSNLGYWLGMYWGPNMDIRIEIIQEPTDQLEYVH